MKKIDNKTGTSALSVQALAQMGCDEFDEWRRPPVEDVAFESVVAAAFKRRDFLKAGLAIFGASSFAVQSFAGGLDDKAELSGLFTHFDFEAVGANTLDTVTLPPGYAWAPLVSWGDPLWSDGVELDEATRGTAETQSRAFGDNNDGMKRFQHGDKTLLVVNNEYLNLPVFYGNRASGLPETAEDVRKGQLALGVSVIEIAPQTVAGESRWQVVKDSAFNRRIHALTPMEIRGPARGHAWMKTQDDPLGERCVGTWNNCGSGRTPWGTYLSCEENFNGFFSSSDPDLTLSEAMQRYGIGHQDKGYAWGRYDARFDLAKEPNEINRAGYVVEFDPADPQSTPKKRTALGRFKHENAEVVLAKSGQVVVYMGDDERGEFLYRFVSKHPYTSLADTDKLLDEGTLYVAKFRDDGRGEWLALTPHSTGMSSLAEICIHTRQAASRVGATTMDRPEWVAVNPHKAEVYCALTNNKNRGIKVNLGGDEQGVGGPNPRAANQYGQIVRWQPEADDHAAASFSWNLFVLAGNPAVHPGTPAAGSANIHVANMFNAPDGVHFDTQGKLWIQTDGNFSNQGAFEGMGNNQMLLANPQSGEIKRFMVGPKACEVTGFEWSPDKKTLFVGIQHPGEKEPSHFPRGGNALPRSTVISIWRKDGATLA